MDIASEERFRATFDLAAIGLAHVGLDGRYLLVNPKLCEILGYSPDELLRKTVGDITHPDDLDLTRPHLARLRTGEIQQFSLEKRYLHKDGRTLWIHLTVSLPPEKTYEIAAYEDITARKTAEVDLAASLSLLRATLESTDDGILVVDQSGRIATFNERFQAMWRIPDEMIKSHDDARVIACVLDQLVDPEVFLGKVRQLYENPERNSFDVLEFKDGRIFERYSQPQRVESGVSGRVWSFRDVTEHHHSERLLKLEHAVARCLAESDNAATALKSAIRAICQSERWESGRFFRVDDKEGVMRLNAYWNLSVPEIERYIEQSREIAYKPGAGLAGRCWQTGQPVWAADISQDPRVAQRGMALNTGMRGAFVFPVLSQEKTLGVLAFNSRAVREPDERMLQAVHVIGRQIGQYLQNWEAKEALRENEERFEHAVRGSNDGIWDWDIARDRYYMSPRAIEIMGGEIHDLPNEREIYLARIHPEDRTKVEAAVKKHFEQRVPYDLEYRVRRQDGRYVWCRSRGQAVWNSAGKPTRFSGSLSDITEIRRAREETERLLRENESILDAAPVGIAFVKDRVFIKCNSSFASMFGYEPADLVGGTSRKIFPSQDAWDLMGRTVVSQVFAGTPFASDLEMRHRDGHSIWTHQRVTLVDPHTPSQGVVVVVQDITERKRVEDALKYSEARYRSTVDNLAEGVIILDTDAKVVSSNASAERILGVQGEEIRGRPLGSTNWGVLREDGSAWPQETRPAVTTLRTGEAQSNAVLGLQRPDRLISWISMNTRPLTDPENGAIAGAILSFSDITERRGYEEKLRHLAQNDSLTGLPNRVLLQDRLVHALTRARRNNLLVGVLLFDLDRFKEINDTLGHSAGDVVLKEVGARVRRSLRDSDTVARLGGDEFCILVEDCDDREKIAVTAAKLQELIDDPIPAEGREIFTGASIGISVYPDDGETLDDLIKNADIAMYAAKRDGGNSHRFFSRELHAKSADNINMIPALRRAIENDELVVHYQPQIEIRTGRPVCVEAVVRWRHPEFGLVQPLHFIHLAEETGLIIPIGEWVLKTACADAKAWQQAGLPHLGVAVNLSARQFRDSQLVDKVAATLSTTGLDPLSLELEITESVIMGQTDHTVDTLSKLVGLGVRISIDDFGTGYSSLAYLKRFPVHKVKIDRAFVRDIHEGSEDAAIVEAIIRMAGALDLGVVAEGVETREQLHFLSVLGCNEYQGYYYARPLAVAEMVELLKPVSPQTP